MSVGCGRCRPHPTPFWVSILLCPQHASRNMEKRIHRVRGGRREALEQMPSNSVWNTSKSQDMPSTMPLLASHPPGSDSDAFASCALAEAVSSGDSSVSTSNLNLGEVISSGWVRLSFLSQPPSFSPLIIRNRFHQVECGKSSSLNCIRGGFEVEGGTYPALNLNSGRIRVECGISCE